MSKPKYSFSSLKTNSQFGDFRSVMGVAEAAVGERFKLAKVEADKIKKTAEERGYEDGLALGLKRLIASEKNNKELKAVLEEKLADLIIGIAEEVLAEALSEKRESILTRIQRALEHCRVGEELSLIVNPADKDLVQSALSEISVRAGMQHGIQLKESKEILPGDARLECGGASVEASVSLHLSRIKRAISSQSGTISSLLDMELAANEPN